MNDFTETNGAGGIAGASNNARGKRLAIVTMGVKLGDETRGYTRFRKLSEMLCDAGFQVDLITSSFQHWDKKQRDTSKTCYQGLPYRVVFIDEPGYQRNLDLQRIRSHGVAARNLRTYFDKQFESPDGAYDLIYSEIPPNDVARVCAEVANEQGIPYVADINDLWPEAMRMVVDIPVISDIAFRPFARDAKTVYELLSAAVGTSDEYAVRPEKDRTDPFPHITVYVGNDLKKFDAGVAEHKTEIQKPEDEFWITYAGTLGASYDLETLIRAAALLDARIAAVEKDAGDTPLREELTQVGSTALRPRVKILGDGPNRAQLEQLAAELNAPVDFLGYCEYGFMAAFLSQSDITVNSLVKNAAQSIVTKIGDYLAAGKPMINTGSSFEFRLKVESDGFGVNVQAEDAPALADAIVNLMKRPNRRRIMGSRARDIAREQFDQDHSYQAIIRLINNLTK
jgi:glycosyltransferase involved in cell wall biosynthesis